MLDIQDEFFKKKTKLILYTFAICSNTFITVYTQIHRQSMVHKVLRKARPYKAGFVMAVRLYSSISIV